MPPVPDGRSGRRGVLAISSALVVMLLGSTLLAPSHHVTGADHGGGNPSQETWCSLWEGDGVSPPSSEGWTVRDFLGGGITTGMSGGETVATISDGSTVNGGWIQRFLEFRQPFKLSVRGRYDPLTTRHDPVYMLYVFTGNHSIAANFYPSAIRISGSPSFLMPSVQGTWYNITFDAKAPLDVDVYRDGVLVGNAEMAPADKIIFDQPLNLPAIASIVTTTNGTAVGMVDYIRTTMCPPTPGPVKTPDRMPPEVLNPGINDWRQPPSSNLSVIKEVPTVTLNATIDDSRTGNSSIWSANYTVNATVWPGTRMSAVDGAFDSPVENVSATLDITALPLGNYTYCFYGRDYQGNKNLTGPCATLNLLPPLPPRIYSLNLDDGAQTPSAFLTVGTNRQSVWLNATVDDSVTGNSSISSANYTLGVANWPGNGLAPLDGLYDSPLERVTGTIDVNWLGEGNHTLCVYGTDAFGMENLTGTCAYLNVTGPPNSWVNPVSYWHNSPVYLTVTAIGQLPVVSIDIYRRYSSDNASWSSFLLHATMNSPPWISTFSFPQGDGFYEFYSIAHDSYGNEEQPPSLADATAAFDGYPPVTLLVIGNPNYTVGGNFINSSTPIILQATDAGAASVGVDRTEYRMDGGNWNVYSSPLFVSGGGVHTLEYRSIDLLGNTESTHSIQVLVDDTPPATIISPATGEFTANTLFSLTASDSGCGVNVTMYRIDGGSWMVYTVGFTLNEGEHTIYYYSIDNLGNIEQEKSLVVRPPVEVAVNYKPLVALVFAIILAVVGVWSSKRKPWKGGKDGMAVAKAFMLTSMPFVLGEAGTGIVSFATGELRMPPIVGVGTAIDLAILFSGLAVALVRATRKTR